jgi:hypothetical protein
MVKPETDTIACRLCTDGSGAATREETERDVLPAIAFAPKELPATTTLTRKSSPTT